MNTNYQFGLLYLVHLLISADGVIDEHEKASLLRIKEHEGIPDTIFNEFANTIQSLKEREIFHKGIELINHCTHAEKIRTFVILYKLSEVDGHVHIKEIRFLLYSIKLSDIEFNELVFEAGQFKSFF
jgi:hypothetical protein